MPLGLDLLAPGAYGAPMSSTKSPPKFRDWLSSAIVESGLSKREIARRMAAKHPRGVSLDTIETGRRTLNKILSGVLTPTQPTRDAIAEAIGRDDAPTVESEDEDEESDLPAALHALARQQVDLNRRINRALKQAKRQEAAA